MVNSVGNYFGNYGIQNNYALQQTADVENELSDAQIRAMKRSGRMQCEECASRLYKDGSDEGNVSFKAPGHISPQNSAGQVMAHENQHVSNAYHKAGKAEGQVLKASVTLEHAICPECGRSYVSGGKTNTTIKYDTGNPYGMSAKAFDAANGAIGGSIDLQL